MAKSTTYIFRVFLILTASVALSFTVFASEAASGSESLSPVLSRLAGSPGADGSEVSVLVFLDNQENGRQLARSASSRNMTRAQRIHLVTDQLRSSRVAGAGDVERYLEQHSLGDITAYWITPAYKAILPASRLAELAELPSVHYIVEDFTLSFDAPVESIPTPQLSTTVSDHLQLLNVPALWQQGLTGSGRIVCSFDTGVDGRHPALASKWLGLVAGADAAWFSTINPDSEPYDVAGHGTHTMGVMVGSTPVDTFGVAPDASWISAGVVDQGKGLSGTFADILAAYQWALNPDDDWTTTHDVPDVILNSWGVPAGLLPQCDATFWQAIDAAEAAGIVTIFAAGNEGPDAKTIRDPADRAAGPLNVFCVGAVDNARIVASFSSRGPSRCNGDIKPEVMAPGVNVYSSTKDGGYAYMSGTSMAAPYIAGLVALCRQYNPDATVEEIKTAFIQSAADLGAVGEDNAYGHGLVDASRLLQFLPEPSEVRLRLAGYPQLDRETTLPGDTVLLGISLELVSGEISRVVGTLTGHIDGQVEVLSGPLPFEFGGNLFSTPSEPFAIVLSGELQHGSQVTLDLRLRDELDNTLNTVSFVLEVGFSAPGIALDNSTSALGLTISDFGQYGFGAGSIYNLGGAGLTVDGSENVLFEAGLVLGTGPSSLSRSIRDESGRLRLSDFVPVEQMSAPTFDGDGSVHYTASFRDQSTAAPDPVEIHQEVIYFNRTDLAGAIGIRYRITGQQFVPGLSFGMLFDIDGDGGEAVVVDPETRLVYQHTAAGYVGLVAVDGFETFKALANGEGKRGLPVDSLYSFLTDHFSGVAESSDDMFMLLSGTTDVISAEDTAAYSLAIVTADSPEQLYAAAAAARLAVAVSPVAAGGSMPISFVLNQNYPNPFNPSTTISFGLAEPADVRLEIYNALGRRVSVLVDRRLAAGNHRVVWDGTDGYGNLVATGVYFYRVTTPEGDETRKMMLLK